MLDPMTPGAARRPDAVAPCGAAGLRAAPAPSRAPARRLRVALYSHDTMGFGHVRRNMLIAQVLAAPPLHGEVLLLSGMREAGAFALPPGVDIVTLPAYHKDADGSYRPRALGDEVERLVHLRAGLLRTALRRFEPDVLIVDNVPRGALGELDKVLPDLRARHGTRCVLGLRDILDEPEAVRRQWWRLRNHEAVRRHYDAVWVYGDARIGDPAREYGFGETLSAPLRHVGYLDQRLRLGADGALPAGLTAGAYALCVVGGGQDGDRLTQAFAAARLPHGLHGVIVAGSMMPPEALRALRALAAARSDLQLLDFVAEPLPLMRDARCVVAMGGYNTVTEIVSLGQRALIVPRVRPRLEQWLRAERMAALGLLDVLHPDALSPARLTAWLAAAALPRPASAAAEAAAAGAAGALDCGALARLPRLVAALAGVDAAAGAGIATGFGRAATATAGRNRLPIHPLPEILHAQA